MRINKIKVSAFRVPIEKYVATSFGVMRDRPAVFVQLEADDGVKGWGEIFANWPAAGAEHRARLLIEDIADVVFDIEAQTPSDFWEQLDSRTRIRAGQCGEWGPFNQVIAGLDTALNDIAARRENVPLAQWLNKDAPQSVPVYASGIPVYTAQDTINDARARGIKAFKVKVGFDSAKDLEALEKISADIGPDERLFADANQGWTPEEAVAFMQTADRFGLGWIEEPVTADTSVSQWQALASEIKTPIAAGENIFGEDSFAKALACKAFKYVQPDVAKWGGVTGCYRVARSTVAAGFTYCPHFLGGGIGLAASAHILAATGGDGLLELDVNPNPLRDAFLTNEIQDGAWTIGNKPGLGIDELPDAIMQFKTLTLEKSKP